MKVKVFSPEREGQFKGKGYFSGGMHWPVGATVRDVTPAQLIELEADVVAGRLQIVARGDEVHEPATDEVVGGPKMPHRLPNVETYVAAGYKAENYDRFIAQETAAATARGQPVSIEAPATPRAPTPPQEGSIVTPVDPAAPPGNPVPPETAKPADPPPGAKPPKQNNR